MSELKDYSILDIEAIDDERHKTESAPGKWVPESRVYLKSEVDKVIAELEQKLAAAQLVLRLNKPEALYNNLETMSRLNHKIDVVERRERHQKFKRCLAMAKWCEIGAQFQHNIVMQFDNPFYIKRAEWLEKWEKRWLELAEVFKEDI